MTNYFDDLLRDVNGHTGTDDLWAPPSSDFSTWAFTMKAAPKKNLSIESNHTQRYKTEGKVAKANKTATKVGYTHNGVKLGFGMESEKISGSVSGTVFEESDWQVKGTLSGENKFAAKEQKAKLAVTVRTPDMSGVRGWINFEAEQQQKLVSNVANRELTVTGKANFNYQDVHVGGAAKKVGDKVESIYAQLVVNDKSNVYWLRSNILGQDAGFGCMIDQKSRIHTHELVYSWVSGFKGLKDLPVVIKNGGEYEMSENTNLSWNLNMGQHIDYNQEVSHKLDKNWTVGMVQQLNGETKAYDVGFKAEYKL